MACCLLRLLRAFTVDAAIGNLRFSVLKMQYVSQVTDMCRMGLTLKIRNKNERCDENRRKQR